MDVAGLLVVDASQVAPAARFNGTISSRVVGHSETGSK
jgi:hypothetical protein